MADAETDVAKAEDFAEAAMQELAAESSRLQEQLRSADERVSAMRNKLAAAQKELADVSPPEQARGAAGGAGATGTPAEALAAAELLESMRGQLRDPLQAQVLEQAAKLLAGLGIGRGLQGVASAPGAERDGGLALVQQQQSNASEASATLALVPGEKKEKPALGMEVDAGQA